jgi:hypothetical protein
MRFGTCSTCAKRFEEKPATVFVAFRDDDLERQCWRMQWCRNCTYEHLSSMFSKLMSNPSYGHCLQGGESINGSNTRLVWLTIYLPRQEREDAELWFCDECVTDVRASLCDGGILQPNRDGYAGSKPRIEATPWPALGEPLSLDKVVKRATRR